jgi:hypothetical protein
LGTVEARVLVGNARQMSTKAVWPEFIYVGDEVRPQVRGLARVQVDFEATVKVGC